MINETITLSSTVEIESGGSIKGVASLNANLIKNRLRFNLSFEAVDVDGVNENTVAVQSQIDSFIDAVQAKMLELGYTIKIKP